jgi:hypothetical protein
MQAPNDYALQFILTGMFLPNLFPSPLRGRMKEGGAFQSLINLLRDTLDIVDHFVVPESKHSITLRDQPLVTRCIVSFVVGMLATVDFDYQLRFQTDEIDNVRPHRPLSAKLATVDLTESNAPPQQLFRIRQITSQRPRFLDRSFHPPSWPSPEFGGRNKAQQCRLNHIGSAILFPHFPPPRAGEEKGGGLLSLPLLQTPRTAQGQLFVHQINRALRIRSMLPFPRAAARMMWNFDERQFRQSEKLRFGARQFHEDRLAQRHRRLALLLQFDGVVDTPRRAGSSSA